MLGPLHLITYLQKMGQAECCTTDMAYTWAHLHLMGVHENHE